jgi:hypothetical protein
MVPGLLGHPISTLNSTSPNNHLSTNRNTHAVDANRLQPQLTTMWVWILTRNLYARFALSANHVTRRWNTSLKGWVVACDSETIRARLSRSPKTDRSKFIGQTKSDPRPTRQGHMNLKNCKLKTSSPIWNHTEEWRYNSTYSEARN